jgi:hypothetical protein
MNTIMSNATVTYADTLTEHFEALQINNKGIIIGRIINNSFLDCGFISKTNVKEITIDRGNWKGKM